MIKSILAALDGSEESLAGLQQAVAWGERLGAEVRTIFVQDERRFVTFPTYSDSEGKVPKPIPLKGEALKKAEAEAAQEESELRAAYERALQGHAARGSYQVIRGKVEANLIREAHAVDLVVLGKRGRGLNESVEDAGPTTETLIHEALRPVLVVPKGSNTSGPVLIPFDGSKGVQRVIVPGVQLAAAMKAPLVVMTLADRKEDGEDIQAPLHDYLKAHGVQAEFRVLVGHDTERSTAKIVLGAAQELKAGMIMMGAYSVGPIREFFVGSVTREVLSHAHCPVLMMT
jgi:nucleotide-binding universal stress UspA family protein